MTTSPEPQNPQAFRRTPMPAWPLTVVDALDVTPRMRRVRFVGEALETFAWRPGQDLVLTIPTPQGEARRHYTVRAFDRREQLIDIDFALHGAQHGDSPATRWARAAKLGDSLIAQGPRGRTVVNPRADWHLFVGDETGLPAIMAMLESLPPGARAMAILEVRDEAERQAPASVAHVDLEWFHRGGPAQPSSRALIDRLALFAPPPGVGQAYLTGETSTVRAIRQGLIARGFPREQICAEGYWRPGRIGSHDHVVDASEIIDRVAARVSDSLASAMGRRFSPSAGR